MPTIAEFVRARAEDQSLGLMFGDERWSYAEYVACCSERAAVLAAMNSEGPIHVGLLLDNVPEFRCGWVPPP